VDPSQRLANSDNPRHRIGSSLRAALDLEALGERSLLDLAATENRQGQAWELEVLAEQSAEQTV